MSRKPVDHKGVLRTMVVSSTASGVIVSVGSDTVLTLSQAARDARLARLCVAFSQTTAQIKANYDAVKASFDSAESSPELVARMI